VLPQRQQPVAPQIRCQPGLPQHSHSQQDSWNLAQPTHQENTVGKADEVISAVGMESPPPWSSKCRKSTCGRVRTCLATLGPRNSCSGQR
jgi:hypothetical protein